MSAMEMCTDTTRSRKTCRCPLCRLHGKVASSLRGPGIVDFRKDLRWAWVITGSDRNEELLVVDPASGDRHLVYRAGRGDSVWCPAFHPEQDEICFTVLGPSAGLYLATWTPVKVERLTGGSDMQPVWAPDRRRIVFFRPDFGRREGHVMSVDRATRTVRRLTTRRSVYVITGFSDDGRIVDTLDVLADRRAA